MITFETQEDFEEAVLEIIKKRLVIRTGSGDRPNVYLSICRWNDYTHSDDSFTSDSLPTPKLRY